ncbi:thioredoxin-like protein [Jimgerdemannia flammicorona]|uniref:Thioredoxin-like protein n=1 Tax=Jimgerdemannia flammicorona TaxID=994334 RepID=A0A433QAD9_9FUNG|nr:thioredoxin-like protein [Jimgerdemannia flammicorona]
MRENEHGVYSEVMKEKTLMELTTTTERIVVHFFHKDFRRCDIMDKHLNELARTHFQTKFCKINVENAKFLVEKLKVQILPCVIAFINAIAVDRIVGFEELGNTDGFQTSLLEFRLGTSSVIKRRDNTITNVPKKKTIFGFAEEADFDDDV